MDTAWFSEQPSTRVSRPALRPKYRVPDQEETDQGKIEALASCEADPVVAFPTEQRERAKAEASRRKAAGLAKSVPRKLPKEVEQHFDDCGSDLAPLLWVDRVFDEWFDHQGDAIEVDYHFGFLGSGVQNEPFVRSLVEPVHMEIEELDAHLVSNPHKVDIVELMGGEAVTTRMLVHRHRRGGLNFDLAVGFDLLKPRTVQFMWDYLDTVEPSIIVMAPVGTSLKGWSSLNRVLHFDQFKARQREAIPLGKLSARVAQYQMDARRHFIVENPADSALYQLSEWRAIKDNYSNVVSVKFDQCMTGLRGRLTGLPHQEAHGAVGQP